MDKKLYFTQQIKKMLRNACDPGSPQIILNLLSVNTLAFFGWQIDGIGYFL